MINPIEAFIAKQSQWQSGLNQLHNILSQKKLEQTLKWGVPAYCIDGKIIIGIGAFKSYFGLWFHQGALLADSEKVLVNAQESKTKALRQWRFTSEQDLPLTLIEAFIDEAVENHLSGKSVKFEKKPLLIPDELANALAQNTKASHAFEAMGLSKKREYADYISDAKRESTKQSRLAKILPMIEQGIGLNDKYKK